MQNKLHDAMVGGALMISALALPFMLLGSSSLFRSIFACPPQKFEPIAISFQCVALQYLVWHDVDHHVFYKNNDFPFVRLGQVRLA